MATETITMPVKTKGVEQPQSTPAAAAQAKRPQSTPKTLNPPPGLPIPLANLSLWQRTVRDHPMLAPRVNDPLPPTADVVIIGGGLCGAVLANALLYPNEHPQPDVTPNGTTNGSAPSEVGNIVLLEARELASGASGRNAGHCRPDAARGFPMFSRIHGPQEARHILESEREVLKRADGFIKKHGIECEWTLRDTYDVFLSPAFAAHTEAAVAGMQGAGADLSHMAQLDGPAADAETRLNGSAGATRWDAATLNPAQLTLGVMELNEADPRFAAYAHAPVYAVEPIDDANHRFRVVTPRGTVLANRVVLATNGYTSALAPGLDITSVGAQAHKVSTAPAGTEVFPPLKPSFSMRRTVDVFYSVAPRPDGSVVLGASRGSWPTDAKAANNGTIDDSSWYPEVALSAFDAWRELYPAGGWGGAGRVEGDTDARLAEVKAAADTPGTQDVAATNDPALVGFEYAWKGILGFTPDMVPLIGDVPGSPGMYVAAGYCGHGMARIFLTAPTLAHYIRTGQWDAAMPSSFRSSAERVERLRAMGESDASRNAA